MKDRIPSWEEAPDHFVWTAFDRASRFPCDALPRDALQQHALLAETDSFYVIPDQFGVVGGHLLILPKAPASSIATIDPGLDEEFRWLLSSIHRVMAETYDARVVVSEHGECGCATADQAHVHAIPVPSTNSDDAVINAIDRTLRRRMIGIARVTYKGTEFTAAEDLLELHGHPGAVAEGQLAQYAELRDTGGRYPDCARTASGLVQPYIHFASGSVQLTSIIDVGSQFVREVVARLIGTEDGAWDRRVNVDRTNMFTTYRDLVRPLAQVVARRYGFRARADGGRVVEPHASVLSSSEN